MLPVAARPGRLVQQHPGDDHGQRVVPLRQDVPGQRGAHLPQALAAGDGAHRLAAEGVERLAAAVLLHDPGPIAVPYILVICIRDGEAWERGWGVGLVTA
jgi:hypothetical protein